MSGRTGGRGRQAHAEQGRPPSVDSGDGRVRGPAQDSRPGKWVGRQMREYFLPLLVSFGFTEFLKHDPTVPDSDVTPEYCAKHNWLVGSPATVAEKLERIYHEVGGFGTLLVFCFDYVDKPEVWRHSLELLAKEVLPRVKPLVPKKSG